VAPVAFFSSMPSCSCTTLNVLRRCLLPIRCVMVVIWITSSGALGLHVEWGGYSEQANPRKCRSTLDRMLHMLLVSASEVDRALWLTTMTINHQRAMSQATSTAMCLTSSQVVSPTHGLLYGHWANITSMWDPLGHRNCYMIRISKHDDV
jgi:hypothetical protein